MNTLDQSRKLALYIQGLPGFTYYPTLERYYHIGATLTDVVFQPGVNYIGAVLPRVKRIKGKPIASIISGMRAYFKKNNVEEFFGWKGRKPRDLLNIVDFFAREDIDTEDELRDWLLKPGNEERLKSQSGFGDKTVDYLKILVGIPSIAVDRHIITLLENAGINTDDYNERKAILLGAAEILNVSPSTLDHSIWQFISRGNTGSDYEEYEDF